MKKGLTELVFILDMSGSMARLTEDTIGGFNAMIDKQKKQEGEALVSCVVFDNESEVLYDRVPLEKVEPMTEKQYCPRGSTALLDAVGGAVHHIGNVHKYARAEDVPEHTIFVITTDGMENASHRFGVSDVRRMVARQQERYGWEFLFLGANLDAVKAAGDIGIRSSRAARYHADRQGTGVVYDTVSETITEMRCRRMGAEEMPLEAVRADYESRRKNG
ncbi:MAG: vWA domain-containing protein [Clostridia bacterium]|nr:vWA domain-containing protein [Clostridia bacterium]